MAPEMRVHRGLARTHQINTLLREFNARDNVAIAVAEREKYAWRMMRFTPQWRALPRRGAGAARRDGHRQCRRPALSANCPTASSGFSRSRSRWRSSRACCCSTSRRRACRRRKRITFTKCSSRLPKDIAILIIEHDMDVIFRFAHEIIVLVQGRVLDARRAGADCRRSRKCARSIWGGRSYERGSQGRGAGCRLRRDRGARRHFVRSAAGRHAGACSAAMASARRRC